MAIRSCRVEQLRRKSGLYKLSYDPVSGFEAITLVSQKPLIFVINPAVPAKSVKELI